LKFFKSFPEDVLDLRLVWRAKKYFLTISAKQRVSYGGKQARVVAIGPVCKYFPRFPETGDSEKRKSVQQCALSC